MTRGDYQLAQNKRVFFRDFIANVAEAGAVERGQAEPARADRRRRGACNSHQHTIATGLDYVVSPTRFCGDPLSYQYTEAFRNHNPGVPTWKTLGVNTFTYTRDDPRTGLPGRRAVGRRP